MAGTKRDLAKARAAHQAACLRGITPSCAYWADALVAEGASADGAVLRKLYQRSCDGSRIGCGQLGDRYREGMGVKRSAKKALELYQRGCSAGRYRQYDVLARDELACLRLGALHEQGRQVKRDLTQAAEAYAFGCRGGGGHACFKAATLFDHLPEKAQKNLGDASKLYQRACTYGSKKGCAQAGTR